MAEQDGRITKQGCLILSKVTICQHSICIILMKSA